MGVLRRSDRIDERTDFFYNGLDSQNFPACSLCLSYSPFLFYVTSANAMASLKEILDPKLNIFCAECLPRESTHDKSASRPFYDMECLFNSPEFVSLFRGYRYNNPYFALYRTMDRIIITENAKISPTYKQLMRKPLPRIVKLHKIQQLFPPVHRMRFQRYTDVVAVFQALRDKSMEIWQFYNNASTAALHDNYDVLTDRSPLHLTRRVDRRLPSDTLTMRAMTPSDDSASEVNSIVITQEENDVEFSEDSIAVQSYEVTASTQESTGRNINSQTVEPNISSQSVQPYVSSQSLSSIIDIQILSESIEDELPAKMALATIPEPNVSSTSSSASDVTVSRRVVVPQRKGRVVYHDSQEAGPSGLQQQQQQGTDAEPNSKRRRTSPPPTNPSPTNFNPTRQGVRFPRLHGG